MKTSLKHRTIETFHFVIALNVVMILILFFAIVLSTFSMRGIQIKLTDENIPAQNNRVGKIVLNVDKEMLKINGNKFLITDLSKMISKLDNASNSGVIIRPSSDSKINLVNVIVDELKKSGVKDITIQTNLAML